MVNASWPMNKQVIEPYIQRLDNAIKDLIALCNFTEEQAVEATQKLTIEAVEALIFFAKEYQNKGMTFTHIKVLYEEIAGRDAWEFKKVLQSLIMECNFTFGAAVEAVKGLSIEAIKTLIFLHSYGLVKAHLQDLQQEFNSPYAWKFRKALQELVTQYNFTPKAAVETVKGVSIEEVEAVIFVQKYKDKGMTPRDIQVLYKELTSSAAEQFREALEKLIVQCNFTPKAAVETVQGLPIEAVKTLVSLNSLGLEKAHLKNLQQQFASPGASEFKRALQYLMEKRQFKADEASAEVHELTAEQLFLIPLNLSRKEILDLSAVPSLRKNFSAIMALTQLKSKGLTVEHLRVLEQEFAGKEKDSYRFEKALRYLIGQCNFTASQAVAEIKGLTAEQVDAKIEKLSRSDSGPQFFNFSKDPFAEKNDESNLRSDPIPH